MRGRVFLRKLPLGKKGEKPWRANKKPIAVKPATWDSLTALRDHFAAQYYWYLLQLLFWATVFGISTWAMGWRLNEFLPSFLFVYVASLAIFTIGQWKEAGAYNLEPPLVALIVGLIISNLLPLPARMDAGFRVEYYIKTSIVLLGATLPFTLIIWAGPLAMLQATIVSIVTFAVIFYASRALGVTVGFPPALALGAPSAGVSGAIAMAGAVEATKEQVAIAITLVILWAIVMIFLLPFASKALQLHAAVAGAWIGNSEFADAAGLAAAQAYGGMAEASAGTIQGTSEQALATFTLMKVIGRDIWIGIWANSLGVGHAAQRWLLLCRLQESCRTKPCRTAQRFAELNLYLLLPLDRPYNPLPRIGRDRT